MFSNRHFAALFIALTFVCFPAQASKLSTDVQKSPNDSRQYAYLTLDNSLKVLLISDPETDTSAASLDISVGSSDDPEEFLGLAHFLEHMLFLGTEKYPEPDEYQKFISDHGGSHNAYTAPENTNYFFDIHTDYLEGALDRFSEQFKSPLFNEEFVQREVNAVHSEFSSKLQDDGRRYLSALKTTLNPDHPYRKFAVGNLSTLVDREDKKLRDALLDFHADEYSANRMRLVVLGKEDLKTLASWVEEKFSGISDKDLPVEKIETPYFSGGFLPAKLNVEAIMDKRSLSLIFPIPSTLPHIHSQPMNYLANLIGHEGKGSLLSALKKDGVVDTLSAGTQFDTGKQAMFSVSMSLTEEGWEQQNKIIETVFSYIRLLKQNGIKKIYFDEQAELAQIGFKFAEKSKPLGYVRALASALHDMEPSIMLAAPYQLTDFNPELISHYLEHLRPENMLVTASAQEVETDKTTQWFKASYGVKPLSISLTNKLKKAERNELLALPEPNLFIPKNTDLVEAETDETPVSIDFKEGIELWHASDTEFGTPKASFFLSVRSPEATKSVENVLMTQLLVSMLNDNLVEFSYPAYLAGLDYNLYKHQRGVTLKINGYSDKQSVLLSAILDKIQTSGLKQQRFEIIKERLKRSIENRKEAKPFKQTITRVQNLVIVPSWSDEEKLAALEGISLENVKSFKEKFFANIDTAILSNGNVEQKDTLKMAKLVHEELILPAKIKTVAPASIRKLSGDKSWLEEMEIDHPDSSFVMYLQGNSKAYDEDAFYSLLSQAISTNYYAELRTRQQLGYIVFASPFSMLDVPGLAFVVQSPSVNSKTLYEKTKTFLTSQTAVLKELSAEDFARYKKAVISRLEEKDANIVQRSNRYWSEIDKQIYSFDSRQQLIDSIETFKFERFLGRFEELIADTGKVLVVASDPKSDALNGIEPDGFIQINNENLNKLELFDTGH